MAIVRYIVANVDESVQFYTEKLGFSVVERMGPAFAVVVLGGPDALGQRSHCFSCPSNARWSPS